MEWIGLNFVDVFFGVDIVNGGKGGLLVLFVLWFLFVDWMVLVVECICWFVVIEEWLIMVGLLLFDGFDVELFDISVVLFFGLGFLDYFLECGVKEVGVDDLYGLFVV